LLPPPLPCDYVDEFTWCTGNEKEDEHNWLGHGYFWKYGNTKKIIFQGCIF
jgi:hypothetical protein